jgi:hypothetical protein
MTDIPFELVMGQVTIALSGVQPIWVLSLEANKKDLVLCCETLI